MSQNKKVLSFLGIIFIVIIAYISYTQFFSSREIDSSEIYIDQMRGKVVKIEADTITVEGYLVDIPSDLKKLVTIDFKVTDKTKYVKNGLELRTTQTQPQGEPYTPKSVKVDGTFVEIGVNSTIENIKAEGNLYNQTKATAEQVTYMSFSYEIPK